MKTLLASTAAIAVLRQPVSAAMAHSEPESAAGGVDRDGLSPTVRPGDDFYRYVNEGWLKTAKPPRASPISTPRSRSISLPSSGSPN
ncbi:hypothetical protein [Erythrobacter tepidarius]|uniref:hypothetical protein n=1 Tax=Erythrobacter tepidarius TaxID=60454 RepID=UPI00117BF8E7|nr:hypothetical protein [Erythrobacter tepidarius]